MTTIEQAARAVPSAARRTAAAVNAHIDRADTGIAGVALGASLFSPWWFAGLLMLVGYAAVQGLLWAVYVLVVRRER